MDDQNTVPKCKRCKENDGMYELRNESHCRDCFDFYIRSKCIKRMESYRIRPDGVNIPTFLLPISFGISSTTLLYLIDAQLRGQRKKVTRMRFKLKILHVDESVLDPSMPPAEHLEEFRKRFAEAGDYLSAKLEDIYEFKGQSEIVEGIEGLGTQGNSNTEAMRALLSALPSPTSREDMAGIVRTRLIVAIAKREGCTGVLWGDTTTRLADKIMTEAAKGRGFSLPWQISDTMSPYGLTFHHPLRDIFKKELVTYVTEITEPPLLHLCAAYSSQPKHSAATATSGRNITMGELLTQYFESMEIQYPSTVSNVVRMGDKLRPVDPEAKICRICGLPVDNGGNELILGADCDGQAASDMCYGCMRTTHGSADFSWPLG